MKKALCTLLVLLTLLMSCSFCFAETYDFANMTLSELTAVKKQIDDEIDRNHSASSSERNAIDDVMKKFVENQYGGKDNISWAWIDYTYTKDWNFFTYKTHADIKKAGVKAQYDIYSELIYDGSNYQIVYAKVGNDEIVNQRSLITDSRVLKQLGLDGQSSTQALSGDTSVPNTTTEEVIVAKRGDINNDVLSIQQFLVRLGYLNGTPDGDFGEMTENAVRRFQENSGLVADGVVRQSVYNALMNASKNMPEPESVISIYATDLYKQYDDNEIAADAKFKDKTVQVTGVIEDFGESWGSPYVTLKGEDGYYTLSYVYCYFSKDAKFQLANLSKGQTITVKGVCSGMSFLSVSVNKCQLVG